ncbi:MAG: RNA-directed DNA polymerase [Ruminococcaceae bacterium]|nr:RNA-directed DNA polymerase [Oscillospiraceae bacterium]
MPKRIGFLYDKMCDKVFIRTAILEGAVGKHKRADVKAVLEDLDGYVNKTYEMLVNRAYVPTPPRSKRIYDKTCQKERTIQIVPYFPDGIMHWLCVKAMRGVLMRGMYRWSCASIPGRGNKCAWSYVKRALKKDPKGTKYCLKMDIKSYYPSIRPKRLIWALARKIKDKLFLKTVYSIVASNPDPGIAVGFYINQWLANYFLEPLDRLICSLPGVKHYVRNMDDMVVFGSSKRDLHRARAKISEFLLDRLSLVLKGNWQVFPVDGRGVDFIGYRFFHSHTALRRRNFLRFIRQCRRVAGMAADGIAIPFHEASGLLSRAGSLKHCDCAGAKRRYLDEGVSVGRLKRVVREHDLHLRLTTA